MKDPINPYPDVRMSIAFISPERAMELLASNKANQRPISRKNLTKIEHDMKRGSFVLTGQPIILSAESQILDGQHRLTASINTKVGFWTVLVTGVDAENFAKIDTGVPRSLATALGIKGEANRYQLATTLQRLCEYMWDPSMLGLGVSFSDSEKLDALQAAPGMRDAIAYCRELKMDRTVPTASVAWLYHITAQYTPLRAKVFFEKLASGEMLPSDSPIYLLRERLKDSKGRKERIPLRHLMALVVKTWNAHVQEQPLKKLKWSDAEAFPLLVLPKEERTLTVAGA